LGRTSQPCALELFRLVGIPSKRPGNPVAARVDSTLVDLTKTLEQGAIVTLVFPQ
jgi:hypothetical protein